MKRLQSAYTMAIAFGLVPLVLGLSARPVSAGGLHRPVVVAAPAYVAPAPVATVYTAPVSPVIATPVTTVYSAPVVDPALVPTAYTTSTVVATPVTTTYAAPAVLAPPARVKVVYPRRVYRFGY